MRRCAARPLRCRSRPSSPRRWTWRERAATLTPALVRHIYDLHMMREHLDPTVVAMLARDIAAADAEEFRNRYPAYRADIVGETRKALDALRSDRLHRERYTRFM